MKNKEKSKVLYPYKGRIKLTNMEAVGDLSQACKKVIELNVEARIFNDKKIYSKLITTAKDPYYRKILEKEDIHEEENFWRGFYQFAMEFTKSIDLFNNINKYIEDIQGLSKKKTQTKKELTKIFTSKSLQESLYSKAFLFADPDKDLIVLNYGLALVNGKQFEITTQYVSFLKQQGKEGKKQAQSVAKLKTAKDNLQFWETSKENPQKRKWLNILFKVYITDKLKPSKKERYRSLPKDVLSNGLKTLLGKHEVTIEDNTKAINYYKEQDSSEVGFIPTDTIEFTNVHPSRIPIVKAGGELFSSFMSHKLLNWENKIFYEQYNAGVKDFRKVTIEGGYKELAKALGYTPDGKNIDKIRKLLCFQAYFTFKIPKENGGCRMGNLLILEEEKNIFGNIGELSIIAGSMLTPEAVYSASAIKGGRLLIPCVDLPEKMIGAPATWGAQAFLQMLVLEHLTTESRVFAKNGSVTISQSRWEKLAKEANIHVSFLKRLDEVRELLCCPDQGFLNKQGDEYAFNKKNEKAKIHLIEQGKIREKAAQNAKKQKFKRKR